MVVTKICDWPKYYNRHRSKNHEWTGCSFAKIDVLLRGPFWQKASSVTLIFFEICLLWYLAQLQILVTSLYFHFNLLHFKGHIFWKATKIWQNFAVDLNLRILPAQEKIQRKMKMIQVLWKGNKISKKCPSYFRIILITRQNNLGDFFKFYGLLTTSELNLISLIDDILYSGYLLLHF